MGLDIYFEKRSRNVDFSKINKAEADLDELDKQIKQLIADNLLDFDKTYDEYWRYDNQEPLTGYCSEEVLRQFEEYERKRKKLEDLLENLDPREEIAYFRKVNFLMAFFNYEGNCEYVEIDREQVEELIDRCNQVLLHKSLAKELLPTTSGFFFGSTDYDEYYFDSVRDVLNTFNLILDDTDWDNEIVEMYAWY